MTCLIQMIDQQLAELANTYLFRVLTILIWVRKTLQILSFKMCGNLAETSYYLGGRNIEPTLIWTLAVYLFTPLIQVYWQMIMHWSNICFCNECFVYLLNMFVLWICLVCSDFCWKALANCFATCLWLFAHHILWTSRLNWGKLFTT